MAAKNDILRDKDGNQIFPATMAEQVSYDGKINVKQAIKRGAVRNKVAPTVASMTDKEQIYVYTGTEDGYTFGNWYYWDGTAWTSGGAYNAIEVNTDGTLTEEGAPADAKATGDKLSELKDDLVGQYSYRKQKCLLYGDAISQELLDGYSDVFKIPFNFVSGLSYKLKITSNHKYTGLAISIGEDLTNCQELVTLTGLDLTDGYEVEFTANHSYKNLIYYADIYGGSAEKTLRIDIEYDDNYLGYRIEELNFGYSVFRKTYNLTDIITSYEGVYSIPVYNLPKYEPTNISLRLNGSASKISVSTNTTNNLETSKQVQWFENVTPDTDIEFTVTPKEDIKYIMFYIGGMNATTVTFSHNNNNMNTTTISTLDYPLLGYSVDTEQKVWTNTQNGMWDGVIIPIEDLFHADKMHIIGCETLVAFLKKVDARDGGDISLCDNNIHTIKNGELEIPSDCNAIFVLSVINRERKENNILFTPKANIIKSLISKNIDNEKLDYNNRLAEKRAIRARKEGKMLFEDDFDFLDESKWYPNKGLVRNASIEYQYYDGFNNLEVKNSICKIVAKRRKLKEETFFNPNLTDMFDRTTKNIKFTSGSITSQNRIHFGSGVYIEARLKCDKSDGLWPAFWTYCADCYVGEQMWPALGEIDVMEFRSAQRNLHYGISSHLSIADVWNVDTENWHIYGCKIYDDRIVWVLDNVEVAEVELNNDDLKKFASARHKLELNLALNGEYNELDGKGFYIDWVRVISLTDKIYTTTLTTDEEVYNVKVGERVYIYTTIDSDCSDRTIIYESLDESIATNKFDYECEVDYFNAFTGVSVGSTEVRIVTNNGLSKIVTINVTN